MNISEVNTTNSVTKSPEPTLLRTAGSFISATLVALLIIAALVANVFVCLAVYKQRSARRITRYFITNLCMADIFVTLISMPVWLVFLLYGNQPAVYLLGTTFVTVWIHVDILCGTASILSLTSISVDRYIAVSRPYKYVQWITATRAMVVIGGIWIYSTIVALLFQPLGHFKGGYAIFILFASFLLPLFVIIAAYSSMYRVATRHARGESRVQTIGNHLCYKTLKRDLKAAKTIAFVIGTFICCWVPFIIVSLCFPFISLNPDGASVAKWLSYLNAVLSPVVYSCVDKQLRRLVCKKLSLLTRGGIRSRRNRNQYNQTCTENSPPMTLLVSERSRDEC